MMQALGISLELIDRCQNHVLPGSKVRRHYLHHDYADEKRAAWRALVGRVLPGVPVATGDMLGSVGAGLALEARRRFA